MRFKMSNLKYRESAKAFNEMYFKGEREYQKAIEQVKIFNKSLPWYKRPFKSIDTDLYWLIRCIKDENNFEFDCPVLNNILNKNRKAIQAYLEGEEFIMPRGVSEVQLEEYEIALFKYLEQQEQ